ncbi:hypothetical protein GWK47_036255 [Chionoecetes opilio]|uniref:MADF domain-containing protein n=1 Tax=Chionoecetes opilio TaxID=41210 RepID=A0A8J4YEE8_CHIOP|nr:hypothetical protein GWK47_036255 [Chionoecetes opilio]
MQGDEVDVDDLISRVKEMPVLWDKSLQDHKSRNMSSSSWRTVCCKLHRDFEALTDKEQNYYVRSVLKKWTNIRDSWLKSQKRTQDQKKSGVKFRRKYLYDKQLAFLKKNFLPKGTVFSIPPDNTENNENNIALPSSSGPSEGINLARPRKTAKKRRADPLWLDAVDQETPKTKESQENRHLCFFKGIIPSLENFNEEQILEFQMGVLNVLQNVREGRRFFDTAQVCSQPFHLTATYPAARTIIPHQPATQCSASMDGPSTAADANKNNTQQIKRSPSSAYSITGSDMSENLSNNNEFMTAVL